MFRRSRAALGQLTRNASYMSGKKKIFQLISYITVNIQCNIIINYFTENGHTYLEIQNLNYIEILNEEKLSMAELILGGEILKRD